MHSPKLEKIAIKIALNNINENSNISIIFDGFNLLTS